MNLQYITDSSGQTAGVFIPINEWNELKDKLAKMGALNPNVPEWHQDIVHERLEEYQANSQVHEFDSAIKEVEKKIDA
jgi:hypothetical protein